MTFIRKIKKSSGIYLAEVKSYRENGRVKQKVLKYVGKEVDGKIVRNVRTCDIKVKSVKRSLDVLAIDKLATDLGISSLKNKNALALIYAHLLEHRSIRKISEWMKFTEIPDILGINDFSIKDLYEALEALHEMELDEIEKNMSQYFSKHENINKAAVVDVTDTYFYGKNSGSDPRRGKDGKVKRLVQIGLAVSMENGFPIMHNEYHGNLSNIMIFRDMSVKLREKGLDSVIIDRGMTSEENLDMLLKMKFETIAGLKKTKSLENNFISKVKRDEIFSFKNMVQLKKTKVYTNSFKYKKGRLIIVYNPSAEIVQKENNFEKGIENNNYPGYSLIYNNTKLSDKIAVAKYYEKDIVERAFKQLKGVLSLRPIRVWLKEHVHGHIKICYLAYAILALMNYKLKRLGISASDALESLKHGYKVSLKEEKRDNSWDLLVPLEPKQKEILKKIGVVYKT